MALRLLEPRTGGENGAFFAPIPGPFPDANGPVALLGEPRPRPKPPLVEAGPKGAVEGGAPPLITSKWLAAEAPEAADAAEAADAPDAEEAACAGARGGRCGLLGSGVKSDNDPIFGFWDGGGGGNGCGGGHAQGSIRPVLSGVFACFFGGLSVLKAGRGGRRPPHTPVCQVEEGTG